MTHQLLAAAAGARPTDSLALERQLGVAQGLIEGKFLAAGGVLCQAVEGIAGFMAGLDRLITALDPAMIAATTDDLGCAAATLSALPSAQAERRGLVQALLGHGRSFAQSITDMQGSLSYMRAFSTNIRITAAAISTSDPEFGLFAQDITERIEAGSQALHGLKTDVASLVAALHTAQSEGAAVEERCAALIPAIPDELTASAAMIGQHHQTVAGAAEAARRVAGHVHAKVGAVLAALQIGDSTSQRIDHVRIGLRMLAQAEAELPPGQGGGLRGPAHALLTAQLAAAMAEFMQNVDQINDSMAALVGDLNELLQLRAAAYGRGAGVDDGLLSSLGRQIELALSLVMEIEAADRAATDTAAAVAKAAGHLASQVSSIQSVKADVNYMALNTILRSNRVGEAGRPLRFVAGELGLHAGQLETSAAACVATLDKLTGCAAELGEGATTPGDETAAQMATRSLDAAFLRIRGAGEQTETDVAALARQSGALHDSLTQFSANFDLQGEIVDMIDATASGMAPGLPAGSDGDAAVGALQAWLAELRLLYTMAQERGVHDDMAASWQLPSDAVHSTANDWPELATAG